MIHQPNFIVYRDFRFFEMREGIEGHAILIEVAVIRIRKPCRIFHRGTILR